MAPAPEPLLNWSFPLCRVAGISVRIHWSLLLVTTLTAFEALGWVSPWFLPALVLIPFLSILLHEFGHSLMARLVGGASDRIIMWAFGGLAMCRVPHTWGKEFIVSAAGPFVTFAIMAICGLLVTFDPGAFRFVNRSGGGITTDLLAYTATFNLYILLFNLLPCYPMDGGRISRALLWPVVGERRAAVITIWLAYAIIAVLFCWAVLASRLGLAFMCVIGAFVVIAEHQQLRAGLLIPHRESWQREDTWLERRQRKRDQARREAERLRQSKLAAGERIRQDRLDELLEKVSQGGLPSLTQEERDFLRACSEEERRRAR